MKRLIKGVLATASSLVVVLAMPLAARAATTVVVTSAHDDGWSTADTRPGGSVTFEYSPGAPAGEGALQLSTDGTNAAKAQYMHSANTPLSDVKTLSYSTKQIAASSTTGDPSYQLVVCLGGYNNNTCTGGTTLVYEPYWNTGTQTVQQGTWQTWNLMSGQWWSSQSYTDANNSACATVAGHGGEPFYDLATLAANCTNAQVVGFGVNIGTYNPGYVTQVDNVVFNDYTYNFELTNLPSDKNACKNGGFNDFTDDQGKAFRNQGDCVSFTNGNNNDQHHTLVGALTSNHKTGAYLGVKDNGDRKNAQNTQSNTTNQ